MNYSIGKKLYHVEYVAETSAGETVSGECYIESMRNTLQQLKHYDRDIKKIVSLTSDMVYAAMSINSFVESATITRIGE